MNILVSGGTGYIGSQLIPALLQAGHFVVAMGRDARVLTKRFPRKVIVVEGNALRPESLETIFGGIDVAYYLIHSMAEGESQFQQKDREAARNFATAAKAAGVQRIIYLGALGNRDSQLSAHLQSRQETSEILRQYGPPVTEFRAAVIIGGGSISFEMIRYLTERVPIMICPRWVTTRIQPIAVDDVISYLLAALANPASEGQTIDIGGTSIETYRTMMLKYAKRRGLRRPLLQVPVLTPRLSSYWVDIFTPISSSISRPLIEGLRSEVVCGDSLALEMFPRIQPFSYEEALDRALRVPDMALMAQTWEVETLSAGGRDPWCRWLAEREGWVADIREGEVQAPAKQVFAVVEGIGGRNGWYYATWLWRLRAWLDRLLGGVGMGKARRDSDRLKLGDNLNFWTVAALEPGRRLLLQALMKIPGEAYLQFETLESQSGGTRLRSAALFRPRGVLGRLYWWALLPVHHVIFKGLNAAIRRRAAVQAEPGSVSVSAQHSHA